MESQTAFKFDLKASVQGKRLSMAQSAQFETIARDLVNVGIALFQITADRIENLQKDIVAGYSGLVTRGAQDKSQMAESLRERLSQSLNVVQTVQDSLGVAVQKLPANRSVPVNTPVATPIDSAKKTAAKKKKSA